MITRNQALRWWLYFRTGYGSYFVLFLGVASTATTLYFLLIENVPALKALFPSFEYFFVLGLAVFIPVCITVGWIHFKKADVFKVEQVVYGETSPYMVDAQAVYAALYRLGEGLGVESYPELKRIKELMKK